MADDTGLAYFWVKGYGTKAAWVEALDTGITIEGEESQSRHHTTFYPRDVTGSVFYLSLAFTTHERWASFNDWMKEYGRRLSEGGLGPMAVVIGARNFRRLGVPVEGFAYGDESVATVRRSIIKFEGTTDPVSPGGAGTSSEPWLPKDPTVRKFFPTGTQLAASDASSTLYDEEEGDGVTAAQGWFYAAQAEVHQRNERDF